MSCRSRYREEFLIIRVSIALDVLRQKRRDVIYFTFLKKIIVVTGKNEPEA